ncbi:MAG: hypothetical protein HND47_09510 [Chloroflexi bacterium]|nr:hypothetical protein [Chloroflexota bacterium]
MIHSDPKPLKVIAAVAASLGIYIIVFTLDIPKDLGILLRYGFFDAMIVSGMVFYVSFSYKGYKGLFLGLSAVFALFGLTLATLWRYSLGEMHVLGGVVYFSDTFYLYNESMNLLDGGVFHSISARRPLFSSFLASLSWLTGRNLQWTLIVLVAINAIACFFLVNEIRKTHGRMPAVFAIVILFFFYRRFIGMTDTENMGFALGALGLAFLWRSSASRRMRDIFMGVVLLVLGLIARAGAFLVLPSLLCWIAFQPADALGSPKKTAAWSALAIVLCFSVNGLFSNILTDQRGMLFSNYAQHLYGISVGGKGWEQVYRDYPDLAGLPEAESAAIIYRLAWTNFIHSPALTFYAIADSWRDFISLRDESVFGFVSGGELIFHNRIDASRRYGYLAARILLYVLGVMGLVYCFRTRKNPQSSLALFLFIGVLFSVPALPPRDAGLMRAYAATIPITVTVPMLGLYAITNRFGFSQESTDTHDTDSPSFMLSFGAVLLVLTVIVPILIRITAKAPNLPEIRCSSGLQSLVVRINPGSVLNIVDDSTPAQYMPVHVHRKDFIASVNSFPYRAAIAPLRELNPPFAIASAIDLLDRNYLWVIMDTNLEVTSPQSFSVCGYWDRRLIESGLAFFRVKEKHSVIEYP